MFIMLFMLGFCYAQNEYNIWFFGQNAGVNFNLGTPTAQLGSQMQSHEAGCTISTPEGELLFYTNGEKIWNRQHQVMPNGADIFGSTSSSQGALIIKKPGSEHIYYVFTTGAYETPHPFYYAEVDMTLDNGNGDVVSKSNMLLQYTTEHMTATRHDNGVDYWVIVHGYNNSRFHAFLVSESGISEPVLSIIGDSFNTEQVTGCMKVSPQGNKLAIATDGSLQLFDFNNAAGTLSNRRRLSTEENCYGVEFSHLGEMLYYSCRFGLFQMDLTSENFLLNKIKITAFASAIQLGPDHKIYCNAALTYLGIIHNPDVPGLGCNFEHESLYLQGNESRYGLVSVVNSHLLKEGVYNRGSCINNPFRMIFNTAGTPDSIHWDLGDGTTSTAINPVHTYASSGLYTVTATVQKNGVTRVFSSTVEVKPSPVAANVPDLWECKNVNNMAKFDISNYTALLLGSQSSQDFTVTFHSTEAFAEQGRFPYATTIFNTSLDETVIYARITSNESGCYTVTAFSLRTLTPPEIDMETEYRVCDSGTITVTAPAGFDLYRWSNGAETQQVTLQPGTYTLHVLVNHPEAICTATKTITVYGSETPVISDVIIQDWTDRDNTITVVTDNTQPMLYSLDGINYQQSNVFTGLLPGFYTVYVKDLYDCGQAQKDVELLMFPRFFTPNGDGHNDTWRIKYAINEPEMLVCIYDRYGKFLGSFNGTSEGWNGIYAGKPLPATDYWFVVTRQDGRILKGHFSLMR